MEPIKLSPRDEEFIKELTGNDTKHESCKEQKDVLGDVPKEALTKALGELGITIEQ